MKHIKFLVVGFLGISVFLLSGNSVRASASVGCNPDPAVRASELITAVQNAVNAGGAQDIDLAAGCIYTLTQVNSGTGMDLNGLPIITNSVSLTITGNGASIVRDPAAPHFRFLDVMDNARLALLSLTLSGGRAPDSPPITTSQVYAGHGGAIQNAGELWIIKSVLSKNKSGDSACNTVLHPLCSDPDFNPAPGNGGAIFNTGKLFMQSSSVENNLSGYNGGYWIVSRGGGVMNGGYADIQDSAFLGNKAGACGACIDAGGGDGGAIASYRDLYITGSRFIKNATQYTSFMAQMGGGAISASSSGNTRVADSVFIGNASMYGSAINSRSLGSFEVTNSTFYNNQEAPSVFGGKNVTLTHVTISNATPTFIGSNLGNLAINNSIINEPCSGAVTQTGNYNVLDPGCVVSSTPPGFNVYTTNAGLDPAGAQNNGGNTETIALTPNSPAINLVPLAVCNLPADQRGMARPQGNACDAGAYESKTHPRAYLPNAVRGWAAAW